MYHLIFVDSIATYARTTFAFPFLEPLSASHQDPSNALMDAVVGTRSSSSATSGSGRLRLPRVPVPELESGVCLTFFLLLRSALGHLAPFHSFLTFGGMTRELGLTRATDAERGGGKNVGSAISRVSVVVGAWHPSSTVCFTEQPSELPLDPLRFSLLNASVARYP